MVYVLGLAAIVSEECQASHVLVAHTHPRTTVIFNLSKGAGLLATEDLL